MFMYQLSAVLIANFLRIIIIIMGPTKPPSQWVPGALSLGVKRPGRDADHSTPSSAEVKE
jgi:hypothetical protein